MTFLLSIRRAIGTWLLRPYIRVVYALADDKSGITARDAILLITNDHVTGRNSDIYKT